LLLFTLGALFFWISLSHRVINPIAKLTRFGQGVGRDTVQATLDRESILPISQRLDQIGQLTRTLLRAERNTRLRLMELTTLNKTSAAVASTLNTQEVINTILDEVQRLLQVRQCALLVMNESTQQLEIWASRGLSKNYPTRTDLTESFQKLPAYQAITTGQPVQVPDIEVDTNFAPLLPRARAEGYNSVLAIPLDALYVPPAVLVIYRSDPHHFDKQEIDLAASFANHAAIALEHATLFNLTDAELQKRVRFLSALNRVGHTVSQSLVMDDILSNAMGAVFDVMPADACWIYLQRETEDCLRLRAQRGFPQDLIEWAGSQPIERGQGVIGQVVQSGKPRLLNETQSEQNIWLEDPLIAESEWHSLVAVPLIAKDTIMGVLGMAAHNADAFTEAELELLQAIGDQIAIAVVNARLYRRSREAAILEERNRMAREIHDTLAQGFTGILVQLQAAERLSLKRPEQALQSLQEARELARESLQEARRSVLNLRPTLLEDLTLDRAIAQQLHRFEAERSLKTDFVLEGYPSPLASNTEQNLYRIIQEALTNVSRHANATCVQVALSFGPKTVTLTISDDGIGLNGTNGQSTWRKDNGISAGNTRSGFGLIGIQERVKLMQGNLTFVAPVTGGTQIKVVIPK